MSALLRSEVIWGNTNPRKALRLQQAINKAGGESRATHIIEQIVSTGKPVLRYETQLNFG